MITDDEIHRAVNFLAENAKRCGELRAQRVYMEEMRKSLKAVLMNDTTGSVGAREQFAYSHQRYQDHLEGLKNAVQADEENKALRSAAELKIEVWRTENANMRSLKI
jgi:DNA-binding transcriptional regulator YbjK